METGLACLEMSVNECSTLLAPYSYEGGGGLTHFYHPRCRACLDLAKASAHIARVIYDYIVI